MEMNHTLEAFCNHTIGYITECNNPYLKYVAPAVTLGTLGLATFHTLRKMATPSFVPFKNMREAIIPQKLNFEVVLLSSKNDLAESHDESVKRLAADSLSKVIMGICPNSTVNVLNEEDLTESSEQSNPALRIYFPWQEEMKKEVEGQWDDSFRIGELGTFLPSAEKKNIETLSLGISDRKKKFTGLIFDEDLRKYNQEKNERMADHWISTFKTLSSNLRTGLAGKMSVDDYLRSFNLYFGEYVGTQANLKHILNICNKESEAIKNIDVVLHGNYSVEKLSALLLAYEETLQQVNVNKMIFQWFEDASDSWKDKEWNLSEKSEDSEGGSIRKTLRVILPGNMKYEDISCLLKLSDPFVSVHSDPVLMMAISARKLFAYLYPHKKAPFWDFAKKANSFDSVYEPLAVLHRLSYPAFDNLPDLSVVPKTGKTLRNILKCQSAADWFSNSAYNCANFNLELANKIKAFVIRKQIA